MAGAYDIGLHYEYEKGRGVAYLSTMERAMGGPDCFSSQSPATILDRIEGTQGGPAQAGPASISQE